MVTRKTPAVRIACSAAFLVLALALVPTALAGKGGKPGSGGTTGSGQTLTGVVSAGTYTVTGHGFAPGQLVALSVGEANGCCTATNIVTDASGSFTYTGWLVGPGRYFVDASLFGGRRWQVVAEWLTTIS
jgi:hypothetical protein